MLVMVLAWAVLGGHCRVIGSDVVSHIVVKLFKLKSEIQFKKCRADIKK